MSPQRFRGKEGGVRHHAPSDPLCAYVSLQRVPGWRKPFFNLQLFSKALSTCLVYSRSPTTCLGLHNLFMRSSRCVWVIRQLLWVLYNAFLGMPEECLVDVFAVFPVSKQRAQQSVTAYPTTLLRFFRNTLLILLLSFMEKFEYFRSYWLAAQRAIALPNSKHHSYTSSINQVLKIGEGIERLCKK